MYPKLKRIYLLSLAIIFIYSCGKRTLDQHAEPPPVRDSANNIPPDTLITHGTPVIKASIRLYVIGTNDQAGIRFQNDSILAITGSADIQAVQGTKGLKVPGDSIQAGDFIIAPAGSNIPGGLLSVVTSKTRVTNGWNFSFLNAGLENIFEFLDINWEWSNDKSYVISKPFSQDIPISNGLNFNVNGLFTFNLRNKLAISIQHSQLSSCSYKVAASSGLTVNGGLISDYVSIDKSFLLYRFPTLTNTVLIPVGPFVIPLVVNTDININLKISALGRMDIEGQFVNAGNQLALNFDYTQANGVQTNGNVSNNFTLLDASRFASKLEGTIKAGIYDDIKINFYKSKSLTLNAGVGLYGKLIGNCDPDSGLHVTGYVGGESYVGGTLNLFVIKPYSQTFTLPIFEKQIFSKTFKDPNFCDEPKDSTIIKGGSAGDTHIYSFDGLHFNFQAVGEFLAVKTDNLVVQCRQEPLPAFTNRVVSLNTAVAVQSGPDKISFQVSPMRLYLNANPIPLTVPVKLAGGGSITFTNGQILITCSSGDKIQILYYPAGYLDYKISLIAGHHGNTIGLLGSWDGKSLNDVEVYGGPVINPNSFSDMYPTYANSWRITDENSLFTYEPGMSTASYTDFSYPSEPVTPTPDQLSQARGTCLAAGITDEPFLSNCTLDIMATGINDLTASARNFNDFPGDSLVAYFPFDGNAIDHSTYGNLTTLSGVYDFTTDHLGNPNAAIQFNGSDPGGQGFANIPNNPLVMSLTNKITVSAWVNVSQWYNDRFGLIVCKSLGINRHLQLEFTRDQISSDGGVAYARPAEPLQLNTWYNIALVVNGTERTFYLNGNKIGGGTAPLIQPNTDPLTIGKDFYGAPEYSIGAIDELRIYSAALSDAQVKELAQ